MPRPRKSTAEHELNGSFDQHPERRAERAAEPKPKGPLGEPPYCFTVAGGCSAYTSERLIAIWNEIVAEVPPGVLTISDRKHVELACRLLYRIRKGEAKSGDYARLEAILGKMAMNPADRSKVVVAGGAQVPTDDNAPSRNPFEEFEGEAGSVRPN